MNNTLSKSVGDFGLLVNAAIKFFEAHSKVERCKNNYNLVILACQENERLTKQTIDSKEIIEQEFYKLASLQVKRILDGLAQYRKQRENFNKEITKCNDERTLLELLEVDQRFEKLMQVLVNEQNYSKFMPTNQLQDLLKL